MYNHAINDMYIRRSKIISTFIHTACPACPMVSRLLRTMSQALSYVCIFGAVLRASTPAMGVAAQRSCYLCKQSQMQWKRRGCGDRGRCFWCDLTIGMENEKRLVTWDLGKAFELSCILGR